MKNKNKKPNFLEMWDILCSLTIRIFNLKLKVNNFKDFS